MACCNPNPADWLMIRRTYSATNFSPLNQVNTGNVKDLQLVWSWGMSDYGANEPTPMVHDGIMFLANTGNIVQALDAKTGERLDLGEIASVQRQSGSATLLARSGQSRSVG